MGGLSVTPLASEMADRGLGRLAPTDWRHVSRFALADAPTPITQPTPVVLGINWWSAFDQPIQANSGRWWLARPAQTDLGYIRGGHAICIKPTPVTDYTSWWEFYDQGDTGECVGFSLSRMMTLLNRVRYQGEWLYMRATEIDEWSDNDLDQDAGTSVRAGCEILRTLGHKRARHQLANAGDGISAYRWATSVEEIHQTIASPLADRLGAVPLVNSWGRFFPHIVWLPDEILNRLLSEDGEAAIVVDR